MLDFHPTAVTISTGDSIRLSANLIGDPEAAATVVYVHAPLSSSRYWAAVAHRVHEQFDGEITQVLYDHRGHGTSARPPRTACTTFYDLAEDLNTVLARASGPVVLVAHSVAALTVLEFVDRYPDRANGLAGVVMLSAATEYTLPIDPRHLRRLPARLRRLRASRLESPTIAAAALVLARIRRTVQRSAQPRVLSEGLQCADPRVAVDLVCDVIGHRPAPAATELLQRVPSIVVAGREDTFVSADRSQALAEAIWGDFTLVPEAGHHIALTSPDQAVSAITDMLEIAYRTDQTTGGMPA